MNSVLENASNEPSSCSPKDTASLDLHDYTPSGHFRVPPSYLSCNYSIGYSLSQSLESPISAKEIDFPTHRAIMTIDPHDAMLLRFVNRHLHRNGNRQAIGQIADVLQMSASQIRFVGLYTPQTLGLKVLRWTLKHLDGIQFFCDIFSTFLCQAKHNPSSQTDGSNIAWNPDRSFIEAAPTLCACAALVEYHDHHQDASSIRETFALLKIGARQLRIDVGPMNSYAEFHQTLVGVGTSLIESSG